MRCGDRQRGCNRSAEGQEFAPKGATILIIACLLLCVLSFDSLCAYDRKVSRPGRENR